MTGRKGRFSHVFGSPGLFPGGQIVTDPMGRFLKLLAIPQVGEDRGHPAMGIYLLLANGVAGAFVGGWLASRFFDVSLGGFFEIRTWLIAIAGSIVVLVVYGFLARSQRA